MALPLPPTRPQRHGPRGPCRWGRVGGSGKAITVSWVDHDDRIGGAFSAHNNNILLMWVSLEHSAKNFYTNMVLNIGKD